MSANLSKRISKKILKKQQETKYLIEARGFNVTNTSFLVRTFDWVALNGSTIYSPIGTKIQAQYLHFNYFAWLFRSGNNPGWDSNSIQLRVILYKYRNIPGNYPNEPTGQQILLASSSGSYDDNTLRKSNPKMIQCLREFKHEIAVSYGTSSRDQAVPSMICNKISIPIHNYINYNNVSKDTSPKDNFGILACFIAPTTSLAATEAIVYLRYYACMSFIDS